jgi:DeoR/GlpR family transcriptional regulator of sugar metabolism
MNWFWNKRQDWIFEMLTIYGFINHKHLMKKFSISEIQASKDLTAATKHYPSMYYDVSDKCYKKR